MTKKRDTTKRPADRRQTFGGSNLLWSLIAAGVAGLFAMSLIGITPDVELSYSDLDKLIQASGEKAASDSARGDQAVEWVEVSQTGIDGRQTARYADLRDVVIGAFAVTGTVREQVTGEPGKQPASGEAETGPASNSASKRPGADSVDKRRRFHTAKLPSENSESQLMRQLSEHGIPFRYEEAPSPWRNCRAT